MDLRASIEVSHVALAPPVPHEHWRDPDHSVSKSVSCRKRGEGPGKFVDIAMIAHNSETGITYEALPQ